MEFDPYAYLLILVILAFLLTVKSNVITEGQEWWLVTQTNFDCDTFPALIAKVFLMVVQP